MTSLPLRYALKDLRGTVATFRTVLLCLILGIAAITAVQMTSRSVLESIRENGRSLLGGDIVIRNVQSPAPRDLRDWLGGRGAAMTETIEARVMLANAATDDATLVELKAVGPGYPNYGEVVSDTGTDVQALLREKGVLLDPSLRERLQLKTGDSVRLGTSIFTVRGFITTEPDRAGSSYFGIAPRAMLAASDLEATGLLQPGSMLYYNLRVKLPQQTDIKSLRDQLERDFPDAQWRVRDFENASPSLTRFVNRLMMFLTLVGLAALLIGGIGIGNGMRAHFETRLKTIAIFKALGATPHVIERIYLWQVGLITVTGTLAGIAVGAALPSLVLPYFAHLLPFPITITLTSAGLLPPALFGLLVGFAFTLWPLGQALGTSPLELFRSAIAPLSGIPASRYRDGTAVLAIALGGVALLTAQDLSFSLWFIGGALACLLIFWGGGRLIARIAGRLQARRHPVWRLSLRNLYRPGNATANTLVSLGLGLTVMVSVTLIELNLRQGIAENLPEDAPAFFFLDIQPDQKEEFAALLQAQPTVGTVKLSPNLRGRIVSVNGVPAEQALVDDSERWLLQNDRGFTYASELPAHSDILSGEWWPKDYKGPPLVSVVEDVQRGFNVGPGDNITVNVLGRDITATIANTRSVNWMNMTINYAVTFAPGTLEAAPHSWLATAVADPSQENAIQRKISKAFPNISVIRVSESLAAAGQILGNIATAVRLTALVAILTGVLVLASSLAATRTQRLYDTVILKVLGVRSRTLILAFLLEFGLLGILAGGIAISLGGIVSWAVMTQLMELRWNFYLLPAVVTCLMGLGLTLLIGWAVTGRILSVSAAAHLRAD